MNTGKMAVVKISFFLIIQSIVQALLNFGRSFMSYSVAMNFLSCSFIDVYTKCQGRPHGETQAHKSAGT